MSLHTAIHAGGQTLGHSFWEWKQLNQKQWKWMGIFCASVVIPPLPVVGVSLVGGLVSVIVTGQCPAVPPDISSYSCSVGEYLIPVQWANT